MASPNFTARTETSQLHRARVVFRSTTVADEPAIRALLHEAHGVAAVNPMFEPRILRWKYWVPRPGWEGSRSYVLKHDDRIVAHAAIVPAVCRFANDRLSVLHVIDWVARRDARGAGNAIMQHIGSLADAIVTSSGSERALPLLPFLGFSRSNTVVTLYARPLRPRLYLKASGAPRWRLAARCLRNLLWAARAPSPAVGSYRARRVAADEVAAASLPWPAPTHGIAVLERSPRLMSYWLQCPAARMELYAVENGSATQGYFVLAFAPEQARLADCWLDSDRFADWQALAHLVVAQARRTAAVAEVVAFCSEPLLAQALEHCGFHARGSRPLLVRARNGVQLPAPGVRVQMLDDDAAYLHTEGRALWA